MFGSCLIFIHKLEERLFSNIHPNKFIGSYKLSMGSRMDSEVIEDLAHLWALGNLFCTEWMGLFFGIRYTEFKKFMLHLGRKNEANFTLLWAMKRAPGVFCWCVSIPYLCDGVLSFFKFQTYPLVCIEKVVRYFGSRNIPFFNFTLQTSKVPELKTLHHCHIFWLLDMSSFFWNFS